MLFFACACTDPQQQPKTSPLPDSGSGTSSESADTPTESDVGFAFEDLTLQMQQSCPVVQTRGDKQTAFFFRVSDASVATVDSEQRTVYALSPGQTNVDVWLAGTTQRVAVFTVTVESLIPQPTGTPASTTESPVSTTEPPVSTTEPQVSTTEPPVFSKRDLLATKKCVI